MPFTMFTAEATPNSKAVVIRTNDLFGYPGIDYRAVLIPIGSKLILEDESNGINVILPSGKKTNLSFEYFTTIGTKIIGVDINSNLDLFNELIILAGY